TDLMSQESLKSNHWIPRNSSPGDLRRSLHPDWLSVTAIHVNHLLHVVFERHILFISYILHIIFILYFTHVLVLVYILLVIVVAYLAHVIDIACYISNILKCIKTAMWTQVQYRVFILFHE